MPLALNSLKLAGVYSSAFHAALQHVLEFEGGWSDHPDDPGGKTYKGITLALLKQWRNSPVTGEDLKALQPEEVYQIYHQLFWKAVRGDELPPALAVLVFDAAVNSGPKNAVLALQRSVNSWKSAPFKLKEDGAIGAKTVGAAGSLNLRQLIAEYGARRMVFYGVLKTFRMFGFGWARRLMAGVQLAQQLAVAAAAVSAALKED